MTTDLPTVSEFKAPSVFDLRDVSSSLLLRFDSASGYYYSTQDWPDAAFWEMSMIPLSHGKGVLWQQAANNRLQVHSTLRLSAFELFAWHTRRCCYFQRWFERLRALTVHTTMLSRIDAITIFRFFGSLSL